MSGPKPPQDEPDFEEDSGADVLGGSEGGMGGRGFEELTRAYEEIRAILDGAADGLLVGDAQGRVVLASRVFGEIWGIVPGRGTPVSEVARAVQSRLKDPERLCEYELPGVRGGRQTVSLDLEDGRIVEWSKYALPLPSSGLGVAWSFRDVTERTELETQSRREQKLEAVGQLAGGIAHDFNNVLFTISSACELALLRGVDEEAAESLRNILHGTQRAADLTRRLLAFSRRQALNVKVLDLNRVIVEIHAMLSRLIGGAFELRLELGEQIGLVRGDRSQLEQVLLNLVVNARDAMPQGGVVHIRTAEVMLSSSDAQRLPDLEPGPHVVVTVSDEGEGMSDEVLDRIFEPFFSTKDVGKGTGLGLASVFGIVKQHNGACHVDSKLGAGTQFRVFLPRIDNGGKESVYPASVETPLGRGETILVVEDDDCARRLTADALTRLGYRVTTACDCDQALQLQQGASWTPDLLLTDFALPHVDGAELARRFKEKLPGVPVVFMSGYAADAIFADSDDGIPTPFLQKPFQLSELARTIRHVLDSSARAPSQRVTR